MVNEKLSWKGTACPRHSNAHVKIATGLDQRLIILLKGGKPSQLNVTGTPVAAYQQFL